MFYYVLICIKCINGTVSPGIFKARENKKFICKLSKLRAVERGKQKGFDFSFSPRGVAIDRKLTFSDDRSSLLKSRVFFILLSENRQNRKETKWLFCCENQGQGFSEKLDAGTRFWTRYVELACLGTQGSNHANGKGFTVKRDFNRLLFWCQVPNWKFNEN